MVATIRRTSTFVVMALMVLPGILSAAGGSSSSSSSFPATPQASAKDHYQRGLKARDKAWALEEKAAGLEGSAADKLIKKAMKQFENAAAAQRQAIELEPRAHQSHSSLGYALRRLGKYDQSIAAYDTALEIQPTYTEAIEYRGEAYLGLGRLEDSKQAYMDLFRMDQEKADKLLVAMEKWVEGNRASTGGPEVEDFAAWVAERSQLAEQTAMLSPGKDWK